ncbi:Bromodomain-containing protein [Massarina eburnea CBS 473.64]|uniref:Bromodomain-containing protein n=1 Tax=Massarina eburnea CBS 473.64 TaxID=1395130 RepID=A0A6A6RV33_9PLEO|nr:Bromodomain-containing protein [Massarina eburnea CBS 473.64]
MAMDLETNGVHIGNGNGNGIDGDGDPFAQAEAEAQPVVNGNSKPVDVAPTIDPVVNVSSGIEGVGELLGHQQDTSSLFGGSDAGMPSALDAVEAPTSDMREEIVPDASAPTQTSGESTQEVLETQIESTETQADDSDVKQSLPDASAIKTDPTPPPTKDMTDLSLETQQLQTSPATADQEMEDAPPSGKVRPREDDSEDEQEDERDSKRARTQEDTDMKADVTSPVNVEQPDSKIAAAPASVSTTPAPSQGASVVQTAVGYKEWPSSPMTEHQRKFLLERIRNTKKIKVSLAFKDPVDPVGLGIPTYFEFVKQPMDLSTIEAKLKEGKYAYVADFMADFDQIITNSELFNSSNHPITQQGYNMRQYFLKGTDRLPSASQGDEPAKASKPVKKPSAAVSKQRRESRVVSNTAKSPTAPTATAAASASEVWPLGPDGMPLIRRESTTDRPKREIHKPSKDLPYNTAKPRKKKYQHELKFCESVLAELMKPKYSIFSFPFMAPVDPVALNIPSYLKIIKKPMDFGTIEKNLKEGQYQSAKDFHADAQLVFTNCYKFNPDGDEVNRMGKRLEELFSGLWKEKADWLAQHAPEAGPPSPGSSDEDDEEEEEEADPAQAQILAIQQQIAQLNETAQQLLQQKRKGSSPKVPSSKKKSAPKPAAQHKRKNTQLSVPPPPKSTKQKVRSRPMAPLSYGQKQEISDGISTLGDADMRKAVQIIRNGCPNLAATNDDEMELDMDEINDDTLRDLLKFIKSVRGPKAAVADDDYDPPRPTYNKAPAKAKKNKPMGKTEQEDSLRRIQEKMQSFNGQASGSSQSPPANQGESSEEESSGSESEEE